MVPRWMRAVNVIVVDSLPKRRQARTGSYESSANCASSTSPGSS